jgi:hypothetical protein
VRSGVWLLSAQCRQLTALVGSCVLYSSLDRVRHIGQEPQLVKVHAASADIAATSASAVAAAASAAAASSEGRSAPALLRHTARNAHILHRAHGAKGDPVPFARSKVLWWRPRRYRGARRKRKVGASSEHSEEGD